VVLIGRDHCGTARNSPWINWPRPLQMGNIKVSGYCTWDVSQQRSIAPLESIPCTTKWYPPAIEVVPSTLAVMSTTSNTSRHRGSAYRSPGWVAQPPPPRGGSHHPRSGARTAGGSRPPLEVDHPPPPPPPWRWLPKPWMCFPPPANGDRTNGCVSRTPGNGYRPL
jgi:hypothetical protein